VIGHSGRQRLILITYAYPPDLAVGALRWQKFTQYGSEAGWGFDVITLHADQLKARDEFGLSELPPDTNIIGVRHESGGLNRAHRAALEMRARARHLFSSTDAGVRADAPRAGESVAPEVGAIQSLKASYAALHEYDHYARWARAAVAAARRILDPRVHRGIVTSGPPHMAHEAGRRVARASGLPLIVDFRDLWSGVQRLDSVGPLWYRFAEFYERRVIDRARLVVTTTEPAAEWLRREYPARADRVIAVLNGFDDEPALPASPPTHRFVIAFSGSIYLDRSPVELFAAAARVVRDLGLEPSDFGVEFMGGVSHYNGTPVMDLARAAGVEQFVQLYPARPRDEVYKFLASAAVLVSLPQDSHRAIPAKIFEYMRFPAWLLILAEADSATAGVFAGTTADVVSQHDVDGIVSILRERYLAFRAGARPEPVAGQGPFSRREQASRLFSAIDDVIAGRVPDSSPARAIATTGVASVMSSSVRPS